VDFILQDYNMNQIQNTEIRQSTALNNCKSESEEKPAFSCYNEYAGSVLSPTKTTFCSFLAIFSLVAIKNRQGPKQIHHTNKQSTSLNKSVLEISEIP
jgi:hypothetical protein